MQLESIDQIVGSVTVFMPSGLEAELCVNEEGNIVVTYFDNCVDQYTPDEFTDLIDAGINIFNKPSQIVFESVNLEVKHPGILEVPEDKKFWQLPIKHFEKLIDKKGYADIIRALTNLETWNKNNNPNISKKASNIINKLKNKFRKDESMKINEDKPFKVYTKGPDENRVVADVIYAASEEEAKAEMQRKLPNFEITKIEEIPEDHDEVTEDFMMIHQSGDGPDASGTVKFIPGYYGYYYESSVKDFNDKNPNWATIRTIDGIRNWFRNVLFEFGAKDVYIGDKHWNIDELKKGDETMQEAMESKEILVDTDYGNKAIMLIDDPKEEHKYVIVDQDDEAIAWGDDKQEVLNEYIAYLKKENEYSDCIYDLLWRPENIKNEYVKEQLQKYIEETDGTMEVSESVNENKVEAMNKLQCIAKKCENPEMRQKALSLLDEMGLGVQNRVEVEKFLKEHDKMKEQNESVDKITERLSKLVEEFDEPKRYIVQSIDKELDDVDQEEFDSIDQAVAQFKMLKPNRVNELIDTKYDEVLLSNMGYIEELNQSSEEAKNEEFDGMLTDIQDLDLPQEMADTISTDENGEVVTLETLLDKLNQVIASVDLVAEKVIDAVTDTEEIVEDSVEDVIEDTVEDVIEDAIEDAEENSEETEDAPENENLEDEKIENTEEIEEDKPEELEEDLNQTKQEIDKIVKKDKDVEDIKNTILINSENEQEEKQAKEYAVDKLKEQLLNTSKTSKLQLK